MTDFEDIRYFFSVLCCGRRGFAPPPNPISLIFFVLILLFPFSCLFSSPLFSRLCVNVLLGGQPTNNETLAFARKSSTFPFIKTQGES